MLQVARKYAAVFLVLGIAALLAAMLFINASAEIGSALALSRAYKIRHGIYAYEKLRGHFPPGSIWVQANEVDIPWRVLIEAVTDGIEGDTDELLVENYALKYGQLSDAPTSVAYKKSSGGLRETDYVAVNSPGSILCDGQSLRPEDISDGIENTLLTSQVRTASLAWHDSHEISSERFFQLSSGDVTAVQSAKGTAGISGQLLIFADYAIYRVIRPLSRDNFSALWTISGNDGLTRRQLESQGFIELVDGM